MPKTNDKNLGWLKQMKILQNAEYNETVAINRLPVEVFCIILEFCGRNELFVYESVCQQWAYFVKVFARTKLVISTRSKILPRRWFYLDERCKPILVVLTTNLNTELIENSFLFGLKQLKICNPTIKNRYQPQPNALLTELKLINRLTALEVLEVSQLQIDRNVYGRAQSVIHLPNLRHLAINHVFCENVLLDCPQLLSFKTKQIFTEQCKLEFAHPNSVTHLHLQNFSTQENLEKLKNLQYLSMVGFDYRYIRGGDLAFNRIFSSFPRLKEISLRPDPPDRPTMEDRDIFSELLQMKIAMRLDQPILTFCGISFESVNQFYHSSYRLFRNLLTTFYLEDYSRLREPELRWTKRMNYYCEVDFPADFHEKFRHVEEVEIWRWDNDEDRLIAFISAFKRFNSLRIKKDPDSSWDLSRKEPGESFYRQLAATCSSLQAIWIKPTERLTDFEFVFQFTQLVSFTVHMRDLEDQFVRRLFGHFETFELNYHVEYDEMRIRRADKDARFEFSVCSGHLEIFVELDDLLEHIEKKCRNPSGEHRCDRSCEFDECPRDSYTENYYKQFKRRRGKMKI